MHSWGLATARDATQQWLGLAQVFLWPNASHVTPSHSCHSPRLGVILHHPKIGVTEYTVYIKNKPKWRVNGIEGMFRKPRTQRILRFATLFFSEGHLGPIIKRLNYGRLNLLKACKWIKIPVDPREYTWSISTIYQQSSLQVEDMSCDENDVPSYLKQLKRRSDLTFTMDHISPTPRLLQRHASQGRRARMTVLSHGHRIMDFGDLGATCRPGHTVDVYDRTRRSKQQCCRTYHGFDVAIASTCTMDIDGYRWILQDHSWSSLSWLQMSWKSWSCRLELTVEVSKLSTVESRWNSAAFGAESPCCSHGFVQKCLTMAIPKYVHMCIYII